MKNLIRIALLSYGLMAGLVSAQTQKISQLPSASAVSGPELIPVVQGGVTSQSTAAALKAFINPPIAAGDILCAVTGGGTATPAACGTLPAGALTGTYAGLTGMGTVSTGTWNATAIGSQYGGTGGNFSASTGLLQFTSGTGSVLALPAGGLAGITATQTLTNTTINSTFGVAQLNPNTQSGEITINVKTLGAAGNWNGTTGTDDSAVFSAAVAACSAAYSATPRRSAVLYIPAGFYYINAPVTQFTKGTPCKVKGDGIWHSMIQLGSSFSGSLFSWDQVYQTTNYCNQDGSGTPTGCGPFIPGTSGDYGAAASDFAVFSSRNYSGQTGLAFYGRSQRVDLNHLLFWYFNGSAIQTGLLSGCPGAQCETASYISESATIDTIFSWANGNSANPGIWLHTVTGAVNILINEVKATNIDVVAPFGDGLVFDSDVSGCTGGCSPKAVQHETVINFRGEYGQSTSSNVDMIRLGSAATSSGPVNNLHFFGVQCVNLSNVAGTGGVNCIHLANTTNSINDVYALGLECDFSGGAGDCVKVDGGNGLTFDPVDMVGYPTITSGAFVAGARYVIKTLGTTDFTSIGAASNTIGLIFTATGVGSAVTGAPLGTATTGFAIEVASSSSVSCCIYFRPTSAQNYTSIIDPTSTGFVFSTGFSSGTGPDFGMDLSGNDTVNTITATGGASVLGGGIVSINPGSAGNFATNVGTGGSTATITLGGGSGLVNITDPTNLTGNPVTINSGTGANATNINTNSSNTGAVTIGTTGATGNSITLNGPTTINGASNTAITAIGGGTSSGPVNVGGGTATTPITIGNTTGPTSIALNGPISMGTGIGTSKASWGTTSPIFNHTTTTLNDTSTTGSVTTEVAYSLQAPTFTSSGGASYTIVNPVNLWLDAPACSGGVICTTPYALYASGSIRTAAQTVTGLLTASAGATITGATIALNTTANTVNIANGANSSGVNIEDGAGTGGVAIQNGTGTGAVNLGNATGPSITSVFGPFKLPGITTDATHTDATVCEDTTSHQAYFGSGTLGVCLGTSSARYKHDIAPLDTGLDEIMHLKPVRYHLNADHGDRNKAYYGFTAEDMVDVIPELVGLDVGGQPNTADYLGLVPVLVKSAQEQEHEVGRLRDVVGADRDQIMRDKDQIDRQQLEIYALALWCLSLSVFLVVRGRRRTN